jgi:hypothetical protein
VLPQRQQQPIDGGRHRGREDPRGGDAALLDEELRRGKPGRRAVGVDRHDTIQLLEVDEDRGLAAHAEV